MAKDSYYEITTEMKKKSNELIEVLAEIFPNAKEINKKAKYVVYNPILEEKTDEASNGAVEVQK